MTKQSRTGRPISTGQYITIDTGEGSGRGVKTTFGTVTVNGAKPSAERVAANVVRSTEALERVSKRITRAGVYLPQKKGVPRYSADEHDPGVYIRRLNGEVSRGQLVNGDFIEIK